MDIKNIISPPEIKKIEVKIGEEVLNVTYRPALYTGEFELRREDAKTKPAEITAELLSEIIIEWDLLNDGKPYPTTKAALMKLPVEFTAKVLMDVSQENSPN